MEYQTLGSGTFPLVTIHLNGGDSVQIESGAMVYHNGGVALSGRMNANGSKGLGGMLKAAARSMTSGESFFITTASGTEQGGELGIAPGNPGAIQALALHDDLQWCLNTGAFLTGDAGTSYQMIRQHVGKALFGGTGGLFVMQTSGTGTMLVSAYGDLLAIDLDGSRDYVIDNTHVVAWQTSLHYSIEVASGTFGFTTGEGLVNRFTGRGRIYIQTRNIEALANMVSPYIATKQS